MLNNYYTEAPPKMTDYGLKEVVDFTKTELKVAWTPISSYTEKVNVTLASGEMPNVLYVNDLLASNIVNAVRSGMFWEIEPYLKEFKNLSTYHPLRLSNAKIDDKLFAIPRPVPLVRTGLILRKDWLDNLNLAVPKTTDEVYQVLKAFTLNDPDKNGTNDTFGLMSYNTNWNGLVSTVSSWFGAPNNWKVVDGKFINAVETPEYMDALKFIRRLYAEKLINTDFPLIANNEARKNMYNSKVGASTEAIDAVVPLYMYSMPPGVKFDFTVAPPIGPHTFAGSGITGGALISKTSVKTEAELKKILRFFDDMRSPEGEKLMTKIWGDNDSRPANERVNLGSNLAIVNSDAVIGPPAVSEINNFLRTTLDAYAKIAIPDPSYGLISDTMVLKGSELGQTLNDAKLKFIVGEIDESGFKAVVNNWKKTGGDAVAAEYSKLYKGK
jgi:putative aldouronate transport system substrate-binding protein